jgi:hypothetical protein
LKFTCQVVGVTNDDKSILSQNVSECGAVAICSQQPLELQLETTEREQVVLRKIPVFLDHSRIVSLNKLCELKQEFNVATVDDDYYSEGYWWLSDQKGLLLCNSDKARQVIKLNVLISFCQLKIC